MKSIKQLLYISCIIVFTLQLIACKDENDNILTEEEVATQILLGTWAIDDRNGVSLDNTDVTGEFVDFKLVIDEQLNYTTQGVSSELSPWPATGSFEFGDNVSQLIRNDGLVISATPNIDGSQILFSFIFEEDHTNGSGGREDAILGEWLFNLKK